MRKIRTISLERKQKAIRSYPEKTTADKPLGLYNPLKNINSDYIL